MKKNKCNEIIWNLDSQIFMGFDSLGLGCLHQFFYKDVDEPEPNKNFGSDWHPNRKFKYVMKRINYD